MRTLEKSSKPSSRRSKLDANGFKAINKAIRKVKNATDWADHIRRAEFDPPITEAEKKELLGYLKFSHSDSPTFPSYVTRNMGGQISKSNSRRSIVWNHRRSAEKRRTRDVGSRSLKTTTTTESVSSSNGKPSRETRRLRKSRASRESSTSIEFGFVVVSLAPSCHQS